MKKIAQSGDFPEADLIDRIANALPAEVRADYYRELRHCRSLPENDEMLLILRANAVPDAADGTGARSSGSRTGKN